MSEENSLHSIVLLDTAGTSRSTRLPAGPFTSENTLSWRVTAQNPDDYKVDVTKFPQGYSRYSALLASHDGFQIWRRFSILRTRLLLLKQDELSLLEEQLENIDAKDARIFPGSLGSNRKDTNQERKQVIKQIDIALGDYDSFLNRQHRILNIEPALNRFILNLRHRNNSSMAPNETNYLYREDLLSLLGNDSSSYGSLGAISHYLGISKESEDKNVYILSDSRRQILQNLLRALQAALTAVLLFTPVVICNFVSNLTYRMIIIVVTTAVFMAILSCIALKRMRIFEMVIAGTTYATVLVVFISGTNGINN